MTGEDETRPPATKTTHHCALANEIMQTIGGFIAPINRREVRHKIENVLATPIDPDDEEYS